MPNPYLSLAFATRDLDLVGWGPMPPQHIFSRTTLALICTVGGAGVLCDSALFSFMITRVLG